MFKRELEPLHNVQIIAMFLVLMTAIVPSEVSTLSRVRACSECQRHTLISSFKSTKRVLQFKTAFCVVVTENLGIFQNCTIPNQEAFIAVKSL